MRIQNVNFTNFTPRIYPYRGDVQSSSYMADKFDKNSGDKITFTSVAKLGRFEKKLCDISLSKFKNFTPEEYNKFSEYELDLLRRFYKISISQLNNYSDKVDFYHQAIPDFMKATLDKKYGQGNYVVIVIGRSLSSIGKSLGYRIGEKNVINIPMSYARRFITDEGYHELNNANAMKIFKNYLNSIGLTKEEVHNSGKKYVIADYCINGDSLAGAQVLLKSPSLLGANENIVGWNVIKDYVAANPKDSKINDVMSRCSFKLFAFVDKCGWLGDMQKAVINPEKASESTRLYWFRILDNFMTGRKFVQP